MHEGPACLTPSRSWSRSLFSFLPPPLTPSDETVDCERFGEILDWFGPIGHPDQTPATATILDHIREILKQAWFHGDLDEAKATARLAGKPANTFLVRFSSQRGFFTISQIHPQQKTVKHWRIEHHLGGGFVVRPVLSSSPPLTPIA